MFLFFILILCQGKLPFNLYGFKYNAILQSISIN